MVVAGVDRLRCIIEEILGRWVEISIKLGGTTVFWLAGGLYCQVEPISRAYWLEIRDTARRHVVSREELDAILRVSKVLEEHGYSYIG